MSDRLHIIISGDAGRARSFLLSRRRLRLTILASVFTFFLLGIACFQTVRLLTVKADLDQQVVQLATELEKSNARKKLLASQVNNLRQLNSGQAAAFLEEKTTLLNEAVTELEERSNLIEQIMCNIGIDVADVQEETSNSGGPYLVPRETLGKDLLYRSDRYLNTFNYLPLGRPVPGPITSRFGHRADPVNGRKGFHEGVDMRAPSGQAIKATADGVVTQARFNGSYGRYIEIDHGNGYVTKFAHMKKFLVKKGATVKRGQAIGKVGNSGRSTGPHLHYEICLYDKPVNPKKFMRVDQLVQPSVIPQLVAKKIKTRKNILVAENKPVPATALEK
ncbi:MAG: M23 family metallopeptidase [Proteobacteria bacterium]|nr:M23 family metallopeptidase [Pseudomonadota bacterium]MBU1058632.1 M23 family metallopeptidase [Pseudomonadota bacterium]